MRDYMKERFHAYVCEKGCGHTTLVNKFYKNKLMHCAVCGEKKTMEYKGTAIVGTIVHPSNLLFTKN